MHKDTPTSTQNPWRQLRSLTPARIALGCAGTSLPTQALLDFQFAHAQARDAVHLPFNTEGLAEQLNKAGYETLNLHSAASDRQQYLQRPDLGRRLDEPSVKRLQAHAQAHSGGYDLAIVIADGLSALAVEHHATAFLQSFAQQAEHDDWSIAPIALVEQGRVALADDIGERLKAKMSLMLIGERPGLSSPDSLGLYFTWAPKVGLTDAFRNCISNVRLEGLGYDVAAHRLLFLMREATRRKLSGVNLKDEAEVRNIGDAVEVPGNFLIG